MCLCESAWRACVCACAYVRVRARGAQVPGALHTRTLTFRFPYSDALLFGAPHTPIRSSSHSDSALLTHKSDGRGAQCMDVTITTPDSAFACLVAPGTGGLRDMLLQVNSPPPSLWPFPSPWKNHPLCLAHLRSAWLISACTHAWLLQVQLPCE